MRLMRSGIAASALSLATFAALVLAVPSHAQDAAAPAGPRPSLVVPIKTATGADAGTASFRESRSGANLNITVALKGLPPGDHAIHIHVNPVCEAPFTSAGGHLNPDSKQHGMENPMGHHAGDMPQNITIAADGTGTATYRVDYLTLTPGAPNSVLGHSIMVHEKADDMKTDPTGNAGSRIACGVIPATAQ